MAILAGACALLGLWPAGIAPALARAAAIAAPGPVPAVPLADLASLVTVGLSALALVLLLGAVALLPEAAARRRRSDGGPTWDCGYARPTARMQYTASSFARGPVGYFRWALLPARRRAPPSRSSSPSTARFESHVPDTVLDRAIVPAFRAGAWARPPGADPPAGQDPALPPLRRRDPRRAPVPGLTRGDPMIDTLVHVLLVLALPPLLPGVIARTKAAFAGRNGPPLLQALLRPRQAPPEGERPSPKARGGSSSRGRSPAWRRPSSPRSSSRSAGTRRRSPSRGT